MDESLKQVEDPVEERRAAFMRQLGAARVEDAPHLPAPEILWVRAQLLKRWDVERRVQAPLDAMEPVQIAAGLAVAGLLLVWAMPSLLRAVSLLTFQS